MDFNALLNQILASGSDLAGQLGNGSQERSQQGSGMSDMTKGAIGGAMGGSLVTLLLGNKKARKMGGKAAKIGGTAALGAFAFKVYKDWQTRQQAAPADLVTSTSSSVVAPPQDTPQHAMLILRAMLAAAKADGHVDEAEQARIYQAVQTMGATAEVTAFVEAELAKPLNPAEIAAGINNPQEASEIYLASLLIVDEQGFMERAYLQELARELKLQPELVAQLEVQASH
ncbi:MAG: tellurite resistance TerB family protein [Parahaliea sp.]